MAPQIVESIKKAFGIRLDQLDWIGDESTRSFIKKKIENGVHLFGYPDYIFNHTELDRSYADFRVSEKEYFENLVSFSTLVKFRE